MSLSVMNILTRADIQSAVNHGKVWITEPALFWEKAVVAEKIAGGKKKKS